MTGKSDTIFPSRVLVASLLAAAAWAILGGGGVWLKVMQYSHWEVTLQLAFLSGILAAVLGVGAGIQAAWRYLRSGRRRPPHAADSDPPSLLPSALIMATVTVAGGSGLLYGAGVFLRVLNVSLWEVPLQIGGVGVVLAGTLGIVAVGRVVWWYVDRRGPGVAESG